jgi:DNA-binding transcriptional LysR family regulator
MKKNRIPSFDDLTVFLIVCETSGFRAAARRLGLSPSQISDSITRLEAQLGLPLFIRNTRSVMPTESGRTLAERMAPLLGETLAVLDQVANAAHQVSGLLKLNVSGAVMVDILPPLIDLFRKKHPAVQVEIMVEDRFVNAIASGCLAGIRYGEHLAQDMISVPIGPARQQLALCAAPAYLNARGHPAHPSDLLRHDCVRLRFSSGALTPWTFERGGDILTIDPPSPLIIGVTAAAAAIELTSAGHGFIYTFKNWLQPALDSGALIALLPDWSQKFDGPRLYFSSRSMPAVLRAFIDFVAQQRIADAGTPA